MITTLFFDFSYTLLFPKDPKYNDSLNKLYKKLKSNEDFKIYEYYHLNGEVLEFLKTIKDKFNLYIFTSGSIQEDSEIDKLLSPIFKEIFTASKLGISKIDPNSYLTLAKQLNIPPEETLFIDDTEENVNTAKQAGLNVILYKSNSDLFTKLKEFHINSLPNF